MRECPGLTLFQRQSCLADVQHCPGCSSSSQEDRLTPEERAFIDGWKNGGMMTLNEARIWRAIIDRLAPKPEVP